VPLGGLPASTVRFVSIVVDNVTLGRAAASSVTFARSGKRRVRRAEDAECDVLPLQAG
jgi:hypothetical protein